MLVVIVWPVSMAAIYFINTFLIPKYLFKERYRRFVLFTTYTLIVAIWIVLFFVYLYFYKLLTRSHGQGFPFEIDLAFIIAGMFLVISTGVMGRIVRENFRILKEKNKIEKTKLTIQAQLKAVEAKTLKSQFHPHFLFNTLNNLYSLSLKKSDEAPKMILKLSELLDHSLNRSGETEVRLEEEISFLQNYIDLAAMRFGSGMNLSFEKNIENPLYPICPNILIPFLENAIKHGLSPDSEKNKIDIRLTQKGRGIYFEIINNQHKAGIDNSSLQEEKGIGLQQVQAYLGLLYPDTHKLLIEDNEDTFIVKLRIHETVADSL